MKEGYVITPNFFQKSPGVKGMHGYLPCKKEEGILISNLPLKNKKLASFMDINKTIQKYFNLNYSTPGESLL